MLNSLLLIFTLNSIIAPANTDSIAQKEFAFKVFPVVYYTTETRGVVEIFSYSQFKLKKALRTSNIRFVANYTQEKQYTLLVPFQLCLKNDNYFVQGKFELTHYPEYFYGIGNETKASIRDLYTYESIYTNLGVYKNIKGHFFGGANLHYKKLGTEIDSGSMVFSKDCNLPGKNGFQYFLSEASLLYDSRTHLLNPKKGTYFELNFGFAKGKTIEGKPISYQPFKADYRQYFSPHKKITMAIRMLLQQTTGTVPFKSHPLLGGPRALRGYYEGRFRDNNLGLLDSEIRIGPFKRIGVTVFSGVGKVASNWLSWNQQNSNYSYGMGLRYQLKKNDSANIRADIGFTKDSYGIYLIFGEAF